jgi:hypothetical protein
LRAVLPAAVADRVDWTVMERRAGSFVSPELQGRHSDLVYRTRLDDGRDAYLFALIEHQVRHEALCYRTGVRDRRRRVVVAA